MEVEKLGKEVEESLYKVFDAETELRQKVISILKALKLPFSQTVPSNNDLILKRITAAMTNIVYQCSSKQSNELLLLRFYGKGTEAFFSRKNEIIVFQRLSEIGFGPKLIAKFSTGRFESFLVNYKPLVESNAHTPEIIQKVAKTLYQFHHIDVPGISHENGIIHKLDKWFDGAKTQNKEGECFIMENVEKEVENLKELLTKTNTSPITFSHCDLQCGNIMLHKNGDIKFIDYEYACYAPRGYDFANYFSEYMYDYNSVNADSCNVDRFPNEETQRLFFEAYLSMYPEKGEDTVESLIQEMRPHICTAALIWILWGIVQNAVSTVDFNYENYSVEKINFYYEKKKEIFGVESLPLYDSSKIHGIYRGIGPPFMQKAINLSLMYGLYDSYFTMLKNTYGLSQNKWYDRCIVSTCVALTTSILVPFERIQTLLSVKEYHSKYKNTIHCFQAISKLGIRELYTAYLPILLRDSIGNSLYFGLKQPLTHFLSTKSTNKKFVDACTGSVLGAFISFVTFPFNVVKNSFQSRVGDNIPLHRLFYIVYIQREGLKGLYRGLGISLCRSVISWGIINFVYEMSKSYF